MTTPSPKQQQQPLLKCWCQNPFPKSESWISASKPKKISAPKKKEKTDISRNLCLTPLGNKSTICELALPRCKEEKQHTTVTQQQEATIAQEPWNLWSFFPTLSHSEAANWSRLKVQLYQASFYHSRSDCNRRLAPFTNGVAFIPAHNLMKRKWDGNSLMIIILARRPSWVPLH